MIGIAISLYDKFDDVRVLVDIIRQNWEHEYYISICCNHPDAKSELSDLDVDSLEQGAQIDYDPSMEPSRGHINLMCRIHDSFRRACQNAVDAGCEYVLHNHADAWMLDEDRFLEFVDGLREKDCVAAVRGRDPTYRRPDFWMGQPMDQYILFDGSYCDEIDFFDFSPLDLLPHTNNHTGLMLLLLGRIGLSNIWFYSSYLDDQWWDGREKELHSVRPGIYVPKWEFLHIATESFPGSNGKHIQAGYLREHNLYQGKFIQEFLEKYRQPLTEVNEELQNIEQNQNKRLKWLGYQKKDFNRKFNEKSKILNQPLKGKLQSLLLNISEEAYYRMMYLIHRIPYIDNRRFTGDNRLRKMYRDAEWPDQNINEIYQNKVNVSDYPEDMQETWFIDRENRSR